MLSAMKANFSLAAAIAAGLVIVGCTVHQTEAPPLTGPSQLALTLTVTATPDSISQNGADQSTIRVTATGPNGEALSGVAIRLQTQSEGSLADFGTLSASWPVSVITVSSVTLTISPAAPSAGSFIGTCRPSPVSLTTPGTCVSIIATPTGTSFSNAAPQQVTLRLVPPGIILPPVKTPKASFTFLPPSPLVGQTVAFNGSASCAESDEFGNCVTSSTLTISSYSWLFGDGSSGSGVTPTHTYSISGTFVVTLTVTNSSGGSASAQSAVTVGLPAGPTADFVTSPTAVNVSAPICGVVLFNADTSKTTAGHNIVQYAWNFGDTFAPGTPAGGCTAVPNNNNTAATSQVTHQFTVPGTYTVTLSILDDTGQRAVKTATVTVNP